MVLGVNDWREIVAAEMDRAQTRYGPPTSTHESFGVLTEEVAELLDAIRANDLDAVRKESIQIAAVAIRLSLACEHHAFAHRSKK